MKIKQTKSKQIEQLTLWYCDRCKKYAPHYVSDEHGDKYGKKCTGTVTMKRFINLDDLKDLLNSNLRQDKLHITIKDILKELGE